MSRAPRLMIAQTIGRVGSIWVLASPHDPVEDAVSEDPKQTTLQSDWA